MKKMRFTILLIALCLFSTAGSAQSETKKTGSAVNGAWHSVDNKEFLIMSDGFFSSVAQDSSGNWTSVHAGTYTIDDDKTATMKATHSSFRYRIGYLHTVEYEVKGDEMIFKLYKKMIDPKAGDLTSRMPKGVEQKYVRAKQ